MKGLRLMLDTRNFTTVFDLRPSCRAQRLRQAFENSIVWLQFGAVGPRMMFQATVRWPRLGGLCRHEKKI